MISGVRLELRNVTTAKLRSDFDPFGVCDSTVERGLAAVVTFPSGRGLPHANLDPGPRTKPRPGALSERLIDIGTYRTLDCLSRTGSASSHIHGSRMNAEGIHPAVTSWRYLLGGLREPRLPHHAS